LQFQALGLLVGTLTNSYSAVLLALGRVWTNTILMTLQVLIQWASMWIGYHYMGPAGVVIGWATVGWTIYAVNTYIFYQLKILHPRIDITVWVLSIGVALMALSRIDWGIVHSWR
jgi:O-antigen/teichoic acid export membrane protein